jgi:5,10-methylenetetrahydromethanopterin reductase
LRLRCRSVDELGFYTLAGAPRSPRDLIDEVVAAEQLGLGSAFISERYNIKEAATLSGAAGAVSTRIGIATAATNHNTRHPLITASYATTMHRLTDGRFTLGLGRGIDAIFSAYGIPKVTTAQMEDFAGLMRRLWRGEVIFGHDGPAGQYSILHLDATFDEDIPLGLVAFGPNTLALAGRAFDMVVLHTFFTDETVERCVATVRRAAEEAGRDPAAVRIWSCYATVGDHLPEDLILKKTVGRLATYLQGYGDLMVETNGWDPAVLARFRADEVVSSVPGAIDGVADPDQLRHIATLLPDEWLEPAATGSPSRCAERVARQFDLGVDGVIMHGATPAELDPVVAAYRDIRPVGRFDGWPANPGRPRVASASADPTG